jgi:nitrous oxide reductase accessory protein NosL
MHKFFLLSLLFIAITIEASDVSAAKYAKLVKKGEKIAIKLCDAKKLEKIAETSLSEIMLALEKQKPCIGLNRKNKEALAYFIFAGSQKQTKTVQGHIEVPEDVKCPVCGMFVAKYPKWVALIEVNKKKYYFDGVKDMMKFYIFDVDFPYDRSKITHMQVTDFYTLQAIDAKKAYYVTGSNIYGPMGNELIPFHTKEAAENFKRDHSGEKIITFDQITPTLVMALDGIAYP